MAGNAHWLLLALRWFAARPLRAPHQQAAAGSRRARARRRRHDPPLSPAAAAWCLLLFRGIFLLALARACAGAASSPLLAACSARARHRRRPPRTDRHERACLAGCAARPLGTLLVAPLARRRQACRLFRAFVGWLGWLPAGGGGFFFRPAGWLRVPLRLPGDLAPSRRSERAAPRGPIGCAHRARTEVSSTATNMELDWSW